VVVDCFQLFLGYFMPGFYYFDGLGDAQVEGEDLLVLLDEGRGQEVVSLEGEGSQKNLLALS